MVEARFHNRLDDWQVVCQLLPAGWEEMARTLGALKRARGIPDANTLLRILLIHLVDGCSLKETAARVHQAGWCSVSSVALFKRLQAAEQWLRWLAEKSWHRDGEAVAASGYVVRAVDATTVQEQGATGTSWRIHYAINLLDLQCDFFELTDSGGGETFLRIPACKGELIMGDAAYSTPPGVDHVVKEGASILVRVNDKALPLYGADGRRIGLRSWLKTLRIGEVAELPAWVHTKNAHVSGRLIAVKRGRHSARRARSRVRRRAQRNQTQASRRAIFLAGYVFVWTTVPKPIMGASQIMELYRVRWQIELAFKRMKSIMGLGQLPKLSEASARAWIHGKLFIALLIEQLLETAEHFSPWGYHLGAAAKPMA